MDKLVDFMSGDVVIIASDRLDEMERIACSNKEKGRYRICLHDSPENRQQEMIICVTKDDYSRPHKHIGMSETHIIIKGRERIVLFDEKGDILNTFIMERDSGYLCYRINSEVFHMSIPLSDTVIELETKGGPFYPESNIYPTWAPDGTDKEENREYVERVLEKIQQCGGVEY